MLVGYEMIIANSALRASLAIIISYPTRDRGIIVNYTHGRAYVTWRLLSRIAAKISRFWVSAVKVLTVSVTEETNGKLWRWISRAAGQRKQWIAPKSKATNRVVTTFRSILKKKDLLAHKWFSYVRKQLALAFSCSRSQSRTRLSPNTTARRLHIEMSSS